MEGAEANALEEDKQLEAINEIFQRLRPSIDDTKLESYTEAKNKLPTRQLSNQQFQTILADFKAFMPIEVIDVSASEEDEEEYDEYIDYYVPQFIINDLAENDRWRIVEILYLQLYSSWGVRLVENKKTGQWTSFYSASYGDSKSYLYLSDEFGLIGDSLQGRFSLNEPYEYKISLIDFSVVQQCETN